MTRRNQFIVLGVLFVVLLISAYYAFGTFFQTTGQTSGPVAVDAPFKPLNVDNPALRMDILKRFLNLEYKGVHRNIFSATLPPPPPSEASKKAPPVNVAPPVPTSATTNSRCQVFWICQRHGRSQWRVLRHSEQ